eukprot:TRINITY_DN28934_c0_g1_i1.p1 TRINITY_DN28934_c0_g1~~TRINITY_DN28934_c0_g1_i1.p1  ORF type:complete len:165 (-),score=40.58 TRINITY_DN28934_c0_g1_i1:19-489(-)
MGSLSRPSRMLPTFQSLPLILTAIGFKVADSCIPLVNPPSISTEVPAEATTEGILATTTTLKQKETTVGESPCVTVELNPGRACVFPFTYQYKEHNQCLPYKGKFWCALSEVYQKDLWGFCDERLCPPTAEVTTTSSTSNTSTATTTTTTIRNYIA